MALNETWDTSLLTTFTPSAVFSTSNSTFATACPAFLGWVISTPFTYWLTTLWWLWPAIIKETSGFNSAIVEAPSPSPYSSSTPTCELTTYKSARSLSFISFITFCTSNAGFVGVYPTNLSASHLVIWLVTTPITATLIPSYSFIMYGLNTLLPSLYKLAHKTLVPPASNWFFIISNIFIP